MPHAPDLTAGIAPVRSGLFEVFEGDSLICLIAWPGRLPSALASSER
jgi:hypothetical protein